MNTLMLTLAVLAAWPAATGESRFELRSQFAAVPEFTGERFALRSQLQPAADPGRTMATDRFIVKAAPRPSGAACVDLLFRDGFE